MTTGQSTPTQTPLLELLIEREMTQTALAKRLGVGVQHVNRWVKRKHVPMRIYRQLIAEELQVPEAEIAW